MEMDSTKKIDICCGDTCPEGFIGIDLVEGPGVDIVADLTKGIPLQDNTVSSLRAYDAIEHLPDRIKTMNEIWRVCTNGATVEIFVPSTDGRGAFQDPTHVSYWNLNSFWYYSIDHLPYLRLCKKYGFNGAFKIESIKNISSQNQVVHVHAVLVAVK